MTNPCPGAPIFIGLLTTKLLISKKRKFQQLYLSTRIPGYEANVDLNTFLIINKAIIWLAHYVYYNFYVVLIKKDHHHQHWKNFKTLWLRHLTEQWNNIYKYKKNMIIKLNIEWIIKNNKNGIVLFIKDYVIIKVYMIKKHKDLLN